MNLSEIRGSTSQLTKLRPSLLLTMVRHGQSEGNKQGVIQGQTDYPLSELGVQQARALRAYLDSHGVSFDAVYSSDLSRARQTAEILASGQEVTCDRRLRTRLYGDFSRLVPAEDCRAGLRVIPQGGETGRQVRRRAAEFLRDLCVRHLSARCPRVLVVTHNWLIAELLRAMAEMVDAQSRGGDRQTRDRDDRKTPNTGVTQLHVVARTDGRVTVSVGEVCGDEHLRGVAGEETLTEAARLC